MLDFKFTATWRPIVSRGHCADRDQLISDELTIRIYIYNYIYREYRLLYIECLAL